MNCPKCGKPMEEGVLSSASPVFWSTQVTGLPLPPHPEGGCPSGKGPGATAAQGLPVPGLPEGSRRLLTGRPRARTARPYETI